MDAAIVTVGDELLSGATPNTNATWLAGELADRGVGVGRILVVPDDVCAIAAAIERYSDVYDAVVVTGGLGGTPDDVTMEGVAAAFDRPMEEDPLARAALDRTLADLAEDRPDLDIDVDVAAEAALPAGARPLLNDAGLSPGCVVGNVYVLPGIPEEMEAMFADVAGEFAGDRCARDVYTVEPEANLIDRLDEVEERFEVAVGCYPDREAGHNRLTVTGDEAAVASAAAWLRENVDRSE